jgi:tetratricopeptide (TPR) repeat protein
MKALIKIFILLPSLLFAFNLSAKELSHEQISKAYYNSYGYEKSGNYLDAIKAVQLVYERYPNTYTVNSRLGSLYRLDGKFRNSIEHYKKALKVLPSSISAKLGLQYTHVLSEDYAKTLEIGYQIISVDYYNYYANYRIAYSLAQTGKYDLAEKTINKMLAIYPADVLFLTELGLLQLQLKQLEKSKATLLNVLILDPENVRAKSTLLNIDG